MNVIDIVFIVLSHISKYPMSDNIIKTDSTTLTFFEPIQANASIKINIIIHGVPVKNFSDSIRKNLTGSKKPSILSP